MSDILLTLLLELLILLCAIGLVLRFRITVRRQPDHDMQGLVSRDRWQSRFTGYFFVWVYLIGLFVILIGIQVIANSYRDYLTLMLLSGALALVWLTILPVGLVIEGISPADKLSNDLKYLFVMVSFGVITGVCVLVFSLFFMIPRGISIIEGLARGPEYAEGIIQKKSSVSGRSGTNYYVDINDQYFHVPNSKWWDSFLRGDLVNYAYNSNADEGSIFPPAEINYTLPGTLVIGISLLLWGITIWGSAVGWKRALQREP